MTNTGYHVFHDAASAVSVGNICNRVDWPAKAIAITTIGFSGRLSIQGSFDSDQWADVVYVQQGRLDNVAPSTAELSFVQDTGLRVYVVSELWPWMRVNITERTAGSVSVKGYGHESGLPSPISRVSLTDESRPAAESPITTPTVYNVTCTVADTQYSQALPANCRKFELQARTEAILRFAFVTGKVATPTAPWLTLKAGDYYYSPDMMQTASPSTLFVASPTAGTVVEILAWT